MFDKNRILPDNLFAFDPKLDILAFLKGKKCFLADYEVAGTTFPFFAYQICQQYNINAKLLLVSLQREQGLISRDVAPLKGVLDRALGFGCTDSGDMKQFYGFELQCRKAVSVYRYWFNRAPEKLGLDFKVDGGEDIVKPANCATYALYQYTPWVGDKARGKYRPDFGNKLTWLIWRRYWPQDVNA